MRFRCFLAKLASVILAISVVTGTAKAQSERSILVLDGSGSMWGQIDGEAKITIAQRVIGKLLDSLPDTQELGLSVYGHRRKGDCADIELAVPPGPNTRDAIRAAVAAVKPKGKTPLSSAVVKAAEALKYEENAATVILISDGRETCGFDPCKVGRRLEETGVGFTAHVIGFDVTDLADRVQLQCLAENTGGRFLSASNASELSEALGQVSFLPPPPPATVDTVFRAIDGEAGPTLRDGLFWTLMDLETGTAKLSMFDAPDLRMALTPGRYRAEVLRSEDEQVASLDVAIVEGVPQEVVLVLPSSVPDASVQGPSSSVAGSDVLVTWTGPDEKNDFIAVALPDARGSAYFNYTYTKEGDPLTLQMPPEPGLYEIRYIQNDGRNVLAGAEIEVTPAEATLAAPGSAVAGSTVVVDWTGPDYKNDFIAVAETASQGGQHVNYAYTNKGSPLKLVMPPEPGSFEIRYVMNQGRTVLARRSVEVTEAGATVSVPTEAAVGSAVLVDWHGPDYKNDFIAVAEIDSRGGQHVNYTYTKKGNPLILVMPPDPGTYEVRYVLSQGREILASQRIKVTAIAGSLDAPDTAAAGATLSIGWTGPDYKNDFISVAEPGQRGGQHINYTYTNKGNPLKLVMPPDPGTYEIRYIVNQGRRILTSLTINVTDVTARLTSPSRARTGSDILVDWAGPDYRNDFISIARPDQKGGQHSKYTYTNKGAPLKLTMPKDPGDYEIRYILNQGRRILATVPITVMDGAVENSTLTTDAVSPESEEEANTQVSSQGVAIETEGEVGPLFGIYGDPSNPNRNFFVSGVTLPERAQISPVDGSIMIGPMWADVAPWYMEPVSDTRYEQGWVDAGGEKIIAEFEFDESGRAIAITFETVFQDRGRLGRLGDLPKEWQ